MMKNKVCGDQKKCEMERENLWATGYMLITQKPILSNSLAFFLATKQALTCLVVGKFGKELKMERVRWKVGVMMRE